MFNDSPLRCRATFLRLVREEDGPTSTEYAVMLAMILMAALGAISAFGTGVAGLYATIQTTLFAA